MGRRGWIGSLLLAAAAAALFLLAPTDRDEGGSAPPAGDRIEAVVERVIDGDTIEVRIDGIREDVRYIGVDTPESVQPGEPVECFGRRASAFNARLVAGRRVTLLIGEEARDRYGRLLAYVRSGGRLVNAELLRHGFATTLTIPPNDRLAPRFRRLELRAARAARGLWGRCPP